MKKNFSMIVKIGSYTIAISHYNKILFPKEKITKADLINYYYSIAPIMLNYCKDRPISMHRYPNGIDHEGFYQKDAADYFPAWVTRAPLKTSEGKIVNYVVIDKKATLVYLANQGCITPHIWLSKIDALRYPDRMIFDLDPSGKKFDFSLIQATAFTLKSLLEDLRLVPFVMTTGSRGLHVVVPLKAIEDFDSVRSFARSIGEYLVRKNPQQLTLELNKSKRGNKIFIDYLRNSYTATGVAPYAVRARPGAPIATPIDWEEVHDSSLRSNRYTYKTVFDRLNKKGDPWESMKKNARSLKDAMKKFNSYQ